MIFFRAIEDLELPARVSVPAGDFELDRDGVLDLSEVEPERLAEVVNQLRTVPQLDEMDDGVEMEAPAAEVDEAADAVHQDVAADHVDDEELQ